MPQARALLIECVDHYLENINKDEAIRPFLKQYPFSEKDIDLGISFSQPNQSSLAPFQINYPGRIVLNEGYVSYWASNSHGNTLAYQEPLTVAREKLKSPLYQDEGGYPELALNASLKAAKCLLDKYPNLKFFTSDAKIQEKAESFYQVFHHRGELDVIQARRLVLDMVDVMQKEVQGYSKVYPFFKTLPFPEDKLSILIRFFKPRGGWVEFGSLHEVILYRGKIRYEAQVKEYSTECKILEQETLEEARKRAS